MVTPFVLETLVRLLTKRDCLACLELESWKKDKILNFPGRHLVYD